MSDDTGIGMSAVDLKYIFDEFEQVYPKGLDDIAEGTGLGLPITKRLVETHSGEIYVESEPGKGSTFTVLLPCIRFIDEKKSENLEKKSGLAKATDSYILIVDYKKENRDILCSYFKKCGQKYLAADCGQRSIEIMNENKDVASIFMDIKMNDMSGTDAMKIIKAGRDVPIVAVTAFAMEGDCENLLKEGFDDYISKPIDIDIL